MLIAFFLISGLFGPWLIYGYDSYAIINPDTNTGELKYHSFVELNPLFGTVYKDNVMLARDWFITSGLVFSSILFILSGLLSVFKYGRYWINFLLFLLSFLGFLVFFLSVGDGISIGVFTHLGWGIGLTGFGLFFSFLVSMKEMSKSSYSRYID
jgi:hypothetical protein